MPFPCNVNGITLRASPFLSCELRFMLRPNYLFINDDNMMGNTMCLFA